MNVKLVHIYHDMYQGPDSGLSFIKITGAMDDGTPVYSKTCIGRLSKTQTDVTWIRFGEDEIPWVQEPEIICPPDAVPILTSTVCPGDVVIIRGKIVQKRSHRGNRYYSVKKASLSMVIPQLKAV